MKVLAVHPSGLMYARVVLRHPQIETHPPAPDASANAKAVYVHGPAGRESRRTDDASKKFVDETRMGAD
ncbi:hypothetical protein [Caballeronia sp. J97]|uniref:hypothetical protein n=1 Tax=Caballeronia sp. J97 TaxID=2805429 RepID=UPI002AB08E68|nr:hypothetical protein [Caballeronia sp. J97]